MILLFILHSTGYAQSPVPASGSSPLIATQPLLVEIGIYILDMAKLDLKEKQFFADFYIWYKWKENPAFPWSPDNIEFMNGNVEWTSRISTDTLWDGSNWATQRIKGTFRGKFNLRNYPFDTQVLPLIIEDNQYNSEKLTFIPDHANPDAGRWVESSVEVPEWKITGASFATDIHKYETNFGDDNPSDPATYSRFARFGLQISLQRFIIPHLIKFIIPLLVIAGMAYLVFYINAQEFEAQCSISVTALLTAVALHISQADALPAVGYLVTSDKIFILFYLAIFSTIVQTVVVNNYAKRGDKTMAERIDVTFRYVYPVILLCGCLVLVLF